MSRATKHIYCSLYYPCIKPRSIRNSSKRLVKSLGFAGLMQWKVNIFKVHRYNMIKGCLHLPFIPSVQLLKILWLLSSDLYLLLQLSVLISWSSLLMKHASSTSTNQATQTNKQTWLRTDINQNKGLKQSALNVTTCYDRDNARTIENGAFVKRTRLSRFVT